MSLKKPISPSFTTFLTMCLLVGIMILQPSVMTFGLIDQNGYAMVDRESEEDTSEKELQEDDNTDKTKELQSASLTDTDFFDIQRIPFFQGLKPIRGINLEIHIPPPEQA
jgi:hypothetical protein